MQQRSDDLSGDYEYDLAHEQAGRRGRAPAEASERPGPAPAGRRVDSDQDMSYDEAHDF